MKATHTALAAALACAMLPGLAQAQSLPKLKFSGFGTLAAEQDLTIEDEGMSQTLIRALGGVQLLRSLCGAEEMTEDEGALRVVVRDRATGELLTDAEVRISWTDSSVLGASGVSTTPHTVIARTDERGSATFCSAPARRTIRVEVQLAGRGVPARQEVTLEAGRAVAVEVRR